MRENTDQENSEYGHFSRSESVAYKKERLQENKTLAWTHKETRAE